MKLLIKTIINLLRIIPFIIKGNKVAISSFVRPNVALRNCVIGKYCYIGENSSLNNVTTGNYCSIATNVYIGGMEHSIHMPSTSARIFPEKCISEKKTRIGNDVWIATSSVIRQGVTIGDGAVVGANSFVNKDVPPYAIVAGSPAKIIRFRFEKNVQKSILATCFWELSPQMAKQKLQNLI